MPLEFGLWRIDGKATAVKWGEMTTESHLEDILEADISIASPNWMVIGRQVLTDHGGWIDLLAIDRDGNLIVIELKKAKTPRDIVAQTLDYGSWVSELDDVGIARLFDDYVKNRAPGKTDLSIDAAFCERFGVKEMPEKLNASQELVIVAASLDPSTERIVNYLAANQVGINAIFFRVFKDGDQEYLARAWLSEPTGLESGEKPHSEQVEWNGEFYVSFGLGEDQSWDEAVKYGFISASGGSWYTRTLGILSPGDRVWANVPATGYVGVGIVQDEAVVIDDFTVESEAGKTVPLTSLPIQAASMTRASDDPEKAAHLVRVKWLKTVPVSKAIHEKGFFGNQNTAARPRSASWPFTVERLKQRFKVE